MKFTFFIYFLSWLYWGAYHFTAKLSLKIPVSCTQIRAFLCQLKRRKNSKSLQTSYKKNNDPKITIWCIGLFHPEGVICCLFFILLWSWWYLQTGHINCPKIKKLYYWSWSCEVVFWSFLYSELLNGELILPAIRI